MTRIAPVKLEDLPATARQAMRTAERQMGFVSNDGLVMARNPDLLAAFERLVGVVYGPGRVDAGLKRLIGLMTSTAAGCDYCQAHSAFVSQRHGISDAKLADVWTFETSERYTAAERAALRVALHAGQSPSGVTGAMFDELSEHFDDDERLEIVAVIAMFGFLNRWNSTLGTDIEPAPLTALDKLSGTKKGPQG